MLLGADLFNCSASNLGSFKQSTGATYPMLLNAASATGGNILTLYGGRDHYVVISKQGIVRYQANDRWPYGDGYHLDEIRGCVDSLVSQPVAVGPGAPPGYALRAAPNPFRREIALELSNPTGRELPARVTVHDIAGRRVATPLDGIAAPGVTRLRWDGRAGAGHSLPPGLYVVRAKIGPIVLERRVIRVR